jgi:flagellar motor protein MotB
VFEALVARFNSQSYAAWTLNPQPSTFKMAGHGGGAWKVAYADFVTAMMAFFLVMWITGQSPQTKEAISGYFQDPWGTSSEFSAPT